MLENPTATLIILGYSCAKITFKQLYLGNHSELITGTYELSFLKTSITVTSHSTELPPESPCVHVHGSKKILFLQFLHFTSLPYSCFHCCIVSQFTQCNVYIFNEYYVSTELHLTIQIFLFRVLLTTVSE